MVDNKRVALTLLALILAGAGLGIAVFRVRLGLGGLPAGSAPPVVSTPATAAAPSAATLPPLEASDVLVRSKAAALSGSPRFLEWLDADDLLRRAAAAADLVSRGLVPKDALAFLGPRGKFTVRKGADGAKADPKAWARYDFVADTVGSIDAEAAAALFRELEPLLQAACRDFGERECDARQRFGRAARELLEAPVPEGAPELVPTANRLGWAYADPALERLSPAQKQLLRMGPRNAEKIRSRLRAFAEAVPLTAAFVR